MQTIAVCYLWSVTGSVGHARDREVLWPALEQSAVVSEAPDRRNDAAVIVAIEQYANLAGVPGARANGYAWYRYLTEAMNVPKTRITHLQDGEARDFNIRNVVAERVSSLKSGGRLWFIFIGHGAPSRHAVDGGNSDGLLVGYDADDSVEGLESRSVHRSVLMNLLGSSRQKETESVAIIDACFSGRSDHGDIVRGLQPVAIVDRAVPKSVVVLTAARGDEFAGNLPGTSRPAFSYLVLGAMRGWGDADHDRRVTAREAVDYASDALTSVLRGGRSQHPTLDGSDEGIVLGEGSEAGPDFSASTPASPPAPAAISFGSLAGTDDAAVMASPSSRSSVDNRGSDSHASERALLATSISFFVVGGIATAVGVGLWVSANSTVQDVTDQCPARSGCGAGLQDDYNDARTRARAGNYLVPIGAGVIGVGAILCLLQRSVDSHASSSLSLAVDGAGATVGYGWRL